MEIIDNNAGFLTNFEVLTLLKHESMQRYDFSTHMDKSRALKEIIDQGKEAKKNISTLTEKQKKQVSAANKAQTEEALHRTLEHTCWMRQKMMDYIGGTPAGRQTTKMLNAFLTNFEAFQQNLLPEFRLSQIELLQLLNLCPNTSLELHKVVEECESRMTEQQTDQLLALIALHLPGPLQDAGEGDEEEKEVADDAEPAAEDADEDADEDVVDDVADMVDEQDVQEQEHGDAGDKEGMVDEQGAFNDDGADGGAKEYDSD